MSEKIKQKKTTTKAYVFRLNGEPIDLKEMKEILYYESDANHLLLHDELEFENGDKLTFEEIEV